MDVQREDPDPLTSSSSSYSSEDEGKYLKEEKQPEKRKTSFPSYHVSKQQMPYFETYHEIEDEVGEGSLLLYSDEPIFTSSFPFIRCSKITPRKVAKFCLNWELWKILAIFLFFVFTLVLFTSQEDPEEVELKIFGASNSAPLHISLDKDEMEYILVRVTIQEIEEKYKAPIARSLVLRNEDLKYNFTFTIEGSSDVNGTQVWNAVKTWKKETEEGITEDHHYFDLDDGDRKEGEEWRLTVSTDSEEPLAFELHVLQLWSLARYQVIFALLILVLVYVLIVFELVHRTIAALIGSFWALALLSVIQVRPAFLEVITWIDYDTLGLLFGMMIMVGIFSETGFFEYSAVKAYKFSRGNLWILLFILCLFTAVVSAFLDNVTTILLLTPVTVRLCKVIDLDPLPIIIAEVVFSNLGGTATAIGDPPNILIVNDSKIKASGEVNFGNFALHVTPGVVLAIIVGFVMFRFTYRKVLKRKPKESRLRELEIWKKTVSPIKGNETEEELAVKQKLLDYVKQLEDNLYNEHPDTEGYDLFKEEDSDEENTERAKPLDMDELEKRYPITDWSLFLKSCTVLICVILLFFLHSFVPVNLGLAWIAILGAMVHLVVSGIRDIEAVLEKVEMGTLLFFAGLFVLMRCLEEMTLMDTIADYTTDIIEDVPEGDSRLAVAVVLVLWVSAIVSAFIDNIPFTTTMIPVVVRLGSDPELGLPLTPLVWALSFGACFGGNGTLIGASANVVAAGLSEQQGYPISFNRFFKTGFPVMIVSVITATIYLLIFHVAIPWY